LGRATTELQAEIEAHKNDQLQDAAKINASEQARAAAEAARDGQTALLADEKKRHETTTIERNDALALAEVSEKAAAARLEEARVQRELNNKLHTELSTRVAQIQQLEKNVFDLTRADELRTKKHNELLVRLAHLEDIIKKVGADPDSETLAKTQTPPPVVEGRVNRVKTDKDKNLHLVEISVGSDDGLSVGHSLYVSRGAKYLGQIKIVSVNSDRAVGSVVQTAKNGIIEEGDHVSSKL
jgi:hypothetical protein